MVTAELGQGKELISTFLLTNQADNELWKNL